MYIQKKITLTGAQTDYDIRANHPELWGGLQGAENYLPDFLITADIDFSVKLNSTAGDAFPVKSGTLGQTFEEEAGHVKNIYITSLASVVLNIISRIPA